MIYAGAGLLGVIVIISGLAFISTRSGGQASSPAVANPPVANAAAPASTPRVAAPKQSIRQSLVLSADEMWIDTGISLSQGDRLSISASGQWSNSGNVKFVTADGWNEKAWPGVILESTNPASLIGKVGTSTFAVGSNFAGNSPQSGRLYLSMNDKPNHFDDNFGSLNLSVVVNGGNASQPNRRDNVPTVKELQDTLNKAAQDMIDEVNR